MATITTDTFLDSATGTRTAGEVWTCNAARLTVRTDTRWYGGANPAPAGMTGSLGNITVSSSLGGGLTFDATNVRWLAFNSGAGVVPAINTSITQGGVTGTLLGVWSSLTAAPTAVGAAMPTTGWLKFREVTGGSFIAGALTGITASATGSDVLGWIEVVMDEAATVNIPRLGDHTTRGGRFFLDNTTGAAGQVLQVPTNGGGANTFCPGVYVETGVGTGLYEFYPAVTVAAGFNTTNLGTDARSKFVQNVGDGQLRIGSDGTTNIGFVPPAGCRTWVPNIFLRNTTAANRALNVIPNATLGTRPDWTTGTAGVIDLEHLYGDWYPIFTAAFSIRIRDCGFHDAITITNCASPLDIDGLNVGIHTNAANIALTLSNCLVGGTIENCRLFRATAASFGYCTAITACIGQVFSNIQAGIVQYARFTTSYAINLSLCTSVELNDCTTFNQAVQLSSVIDSEVNNLTVIDRLVGISNGTASLSPVVILTGSSNILVDGISFGGYAGVSPTGAVFSVQNASSIRIQNAGTLTAPLAVGSPAPRFLLDNGGNNDVTVKRIYLAGSSANVLSNTSQNYTFENVGGNPIVTLTQGVNLARFKGVGATRPTAGSNAVYGTDWSDYFPSTTTGTVFLSFNEPISDKLPFYTVDAGAPRFTSTGGLAMFTIGDQITWTMDYFALGHLSFQNVAPVMNGGTAANYALEYRLDTGTGFSGAFKALTGANLSAESISASAGFRLQFRITTTTTNTTPITHLAVATTSSTVAQGNLYPIVSVPHTYTLTGLLAGTEVILFNSSNVELSRQTLSGTSFTYNYTFTGTPSTGNYALVWKADKEPIKLTAITLGDADQSVPLSQVDDLVYDGAYTPISSIDFSNKLQILNTGTTTAPVPQLYSEWKDAIRLSANAQYDFAYAAVGGNAITGSTEIPAYVFQLNGWKVRPQEANHTLNITNGILVGQAGADPFVNTLGAYVVRVNYQQPVQAIAVAGTGGITAEQVWTYSDRTLNPPALTLPQFLALKD